MIAKLQTLPPSDTKFTQLSLEEKILQTHAQLIATAKHAGVVLPRL